jgi:hypothetical protein
MAGPEDFDSSRRGLFRDVHFEGAFARRVASAYGDAWGAGREAEAGFAGQEAEDEGKTTNPQMSALAACVSGVRDISQILK